MKKNILFVYSFYRFKKINDKRLLIKNLLNFTKGYKVKGTLLIADEGLNGSISGYEHELSSFIKYLKNECKIKKLFIKKNQTTFLPFKKFKIRSKNEIVSLGQKNITFRNKSLNYIKPDNWKNFISRKQIKLIDVRNKYEIAIGKFKNSINPNTNTFREFPKIIKKQKIKKTDTIAMYCTGGIRCEKAASYLSKNGYKNVFQLEGGILNYFEYNKSDKKKENIFIGECFVFDDRVSLNQSLSKGKYDQCHGCRMPLTQSEKKSMLYIKGVQCPKCFNNRTENQKARSATRQKQIDLAEKRNLQHSFKREF